MATVEGVAVDVRDVTDEEVGHFEEKGWSNRSLIPANDR